MTAPTHAVASITTVSFFSLLVPAFRPDTYAILWATLFSLLPDIDNPKSFIGRFPFFWASGWFDRNFGHRTLTHSFIALFFSAFVLAFALFLYFGSWSKTVYIYVFAAWLGYFSHLILDAATKQGIMCYWPARLWGVMPPRASARIRTGSRLEILYFAIFLVLAFVFLPSSQSNIMTTFNRLFSPGKIPAREALLEAKEQKVSMGFTIPQIDSLLKAGAIDPKQANEIKSAILSVEAEKKAFLQDNGFAADSSQDK
jgi:membrane-bound metal-dependent hydrolase YbcI (DUF457 family)